MIEKYMEKLPVNKIISFSNVDGPGNRMAIFVQSCPFRCLYCHNPETINMCCSCGQCVSTCPVNALSFDDQNKVIWDKNKCVNCDTCIKTCPNLSSPKIAYYSLEELLTKIKEVRPFIRGITISGGECTSYPSFIKKLFIEVKKLGLTCLLDSNGSYDFKTMEDLIDISDGVMLDVKAFDDDYHKFITSKSNDVVLKNLQYLLDKNKLEEVRTVILPNNDKQNENTVIQVSKIIKSNVRYKLLKYRYFGVREEGVKTFGKVIVDQDTLERLKDIALDNGCCSVVII